MDDSGSSGSSDSSSSSSDNTSSSNDSVYDESPRGADESVTSETSSTVEDSDSSEATPRTGGSTHSGSDIPKQSSSPGIIILQWLTYAFWGWTILSLVWLVFIVIANIMTTQDTSGMVPYAIAATLVLLPIAVVCDIFYLRHEPVKKHGAAMVVMVIHAVIFALFGIGVLITGVLSLVQLLIGTTDGHLTLVTWIITALISAAVYLLTFLRTLNPFARLRLARWYWVVMVVVVGGFIVAGFVGPVVQARLAQDDRDLEDNITQIADRISARAETTGQLPASLTDIELTAKQKELIGKGLLTYTREQSASKPDTDTDSSLPFLRYQLCATFKRESSYYSERYAVGEREYSSYISASSHPAGKTCYKVEVGPKS